MASTVNWTTFASSHTLFNVGSEAVCMLCDNILCFTDLKTNAMSYYKAESPELGLSIQAAAGHNKFALVAFCELVLKPSVHIIEYPTFAKYAVFQIKDIITFVDIRFNDYDLVLALSGYPNYTFCVWNFRTGQQLVKCDTFRVSTAKSILCSHRHTPQIVQFSKLNNEILLWELCYTSTGVDLHEISKVQLSENFTFSNMSCLCYGEDDCLYMVDNFGGIFLLEVAQSRLQLQWSVSADGLEVDNNLKHFRLEYHRQSLLAYCKEVVYCLRRKQSKWYCEWKLVPPALPSGLSKCLSNGNGELYAGAGEGDVYHVDLSNGSVQLNLIQAHKNESTIDVAILKGVREECLLQLTTTKRVYALALARYEPYSIMEVPEANAIVAHNVSPYVMVGTSHGQIHFLNYFDIRQPFIIATIETKNSYPIGSVLFLNKIAVYSTIYNEFSLIRADIESNIIYEVVSFERFTEKVGINECILDDNRFFIFFNRDSSILLPHANEMYCYRYYPDQRQYDRFDFELPFVYRDVSGLTVPMPNVVEFFAVRLETSIMDYLNLNTETNELVIVHSIQTKHFAHISGITGSVNILTWGVDGTFLHYRMHRMSPRPYGSCQLLQIKYRPRVVYKVLECFMAKYLIYMYSQGGIKVMQPVSSGIESFENIFINEIPITVDIKMITTRPIDKRYSELFVEHTPEEYEARDKLLEKIQALGRELTDLINYDISVTGKSEGVYKKFCLNHQWLDKLTEEAHKVYEVERGSTEAAIADQSRIRNWIYFIITSENAGITYKIRAIFSDFSVENFGLHKRLKFEQLFDLYRFYEMDSVDNEEMEEADELGEFNERKEQSDSQDKKNITYFGVRGPIYEHIMRDELAMQDVDIVTGNQMINQDSKLRILLIDRLKEDFNKQFKEIRQTKHELMEAILATNATLTAIYSNMNCMLRLLGRDEIEIPQLSVPEWQKDEFVKSIMEVDDSEIKAINRRKKKEEIKAAKSGRLLLWSLQFWQRALIAMMDGVLEKLWEEEIKKDIPKPEFLTKKDVGEYTLEDQKALKEYEEKCRLLQEDRKKYLRILTENDLKTNQLKRMYILKLNENITRLMITKLKYDFAIEHVRLRNFNTKIMYFKKLKWLERINFLRFVTIEYFIGCTILLLAGIYSFAKRNIAIMDRKEIHSTSEYIIKYGKLYEFWSKSVDDFRLKVDNLMVKQKAIERQFRSQFLSSIAQHLGPEMFKIFRKRPKFAPKFYNSTLICTELSMRINSKVQPKFPFPLPNDVYEYLEDLNSLDDISNMPVSLEPRYWDQFVKLRRQKVEIELKIRAVNLQLVDGSSDMSLYGNELESLKDMKLNAIERLYEAQEEYLRSIQDQTLELRLTMGQVEFNIMGSLKNLENCVLLHQNDVNDINALILRAGEQKIKAMQRVATFRRQVIYKEWEHKVVSANIDYLNNMLVIIGKCKVSKEFLNVLRNWNKVKEEKQRLLNTVGLLERVAEEKLAGYKKELTRVNKQISQMRQQIDDMKRNNKRIDRRIDQMKMSVTFAQTSRDFVMEDRNKRVQNEKMAKIKRHSNLLESVRRDYVHIMELKTILELQRLRTYPTLGPNPSQCATDNF